MAEMGDPTVWDICRVATVNEILDASEDAERDAARPKAKTNDQIRAEANR